MPELPEVETIRRQLDEKLAGARIKDVKILRTGKETPAGKRFVDKVKGQIIVSIERRAKLLIFKFKQGDALIAHLKMTGRLILVAKNYRPQKHDRIIFYFNIPQALVWSDLRQFGFLKAIKGHELEKILSVYGPEPLEVSTSELAELLRVESKRSLKAVMLDQTRIAGIGNIYADEACHRAGILPTRKISTLKAIEREKLARAIKNVLRESIAKQGTSADSYVNAFGKEGRFLSRLRVYGRKGKSCLRCGTSIKKISHAQRGTHFCPGCQR